MRVVVERVSKVYADRAGHTVRALDGIDLSVEAEEFVAVLGPSGCSKSTLLDLIAGLLAPPSPSARAAGRSSARSSRLRRCR